MAQNSGIGNNLGLKCVLVTRMGALGDVVMTIPVVYSVCRCYPDVKFVLVTREAYASLFVERPPNLTVEGIDMQRLQGLRSGYDTAAGLHAKYGFDAFVDLQNDSSTHMLRLFCRLHGIRISKFNKALSHKRALTRKANKVMLPLVSTRARYREAFFNIHLPVSDRFDGLYGHSGRGDTALFASFAPAKQSRWIGVAPFAAYPQKEYPLDKMEEVVKALSDDPANHIFIFGGDGREMDIAAQWAEKYPSVTTLAGRRHGFPAELALLSHLDLMITMDSANMHLASIVGTPTLSIWGATHHYCGFRGWHQSENNMVQLPLSCRPCSITGEKDCCRHDTLCLTAIRPEMIYQKAQELLGND